MISLYKRNHIGCVLLFSMVILSVQTALIRSSHRHQETNQTQPTHGPREIVGIWRITKIMSLLGPNVSIYIYNELYKAFEKHGPLLSARFQAIVRNLNSNTANGSESGRLRSIPRSLRKEENPFVLKIANEVIRITNMRLREKAVVSRLQMDDDQYELCRRHAASDVARVAINVLQDVLEKGCGANLDSKDKLAVRSMIKGSIAQYAMDRSWHNRLFRVM